MDAGMKKSLIAVVFILLSGMVQAPSLSSTPSTLDIGEVERGQTYQYNLYVTPRDAQGAVEVNYNVQGPFYSSLFNSSEIEGNLVSQQDIGSWIEFQKDSVIADPSQTKTFETRNGGKVKAAAKIPIEIQVPQDAEPGYHAANIRFGVSNVEDGQGFATSNWVLPYIPVEMKVPGNAERSLDVQDFRMIRVGENQAQVIVLLENTGTVTTEFRGATVDILNQDNQKVGEVSLNSVKIPPGETQEVSAIWQSGGMDPGTYQISGTGDYITGRFFIGGTGAIEQAIRERVEVEDPQGDATGEGSNMPTWLVAMIIMLLGIIMYSFDIDPLWIVLIIGLISISAFVIMTGLPLYLIAITLIVGVLMIYYGLI